MKRANRRTRRGERRPRARCRMVTISTPAVRVAGAFRPRVRGARAGRRAQRPDRHRRRGSDSGRSRRPGLGRTRCPATGPDRCRCPGRPRSTRCCRCRCPGLALAVPVPVPLTVAGALAGVGTVVVTGVVLPAGAAVVLARLRICGVARRVAGRRVVRAGVTRLVGRLAVVDRLLVPGRQVVVDRLLVPGRIACVAGRLCRVVTGGRIGRRLARAGRERLRRAAVAPGVGSLRARAAGRRVTGLRRVARRRCAPRRVLARAPDRPRGVGRVRRGRAARRAGNGSRAVAAIACPGVGGRCRGIGAGSLSGLRRGAGSRCGSIPRLGRPVAARADRRGRGSVARAGTARARTLVLGERGRRDSRRRCVMPPRKGRGHERRPSCRDLGVVRSHREPDRAVLRGADVPEGRPGQVEDRGESPRRVERKLQAEHRGDGYHQQCRRDRSDLP